MTKKLTEKELKQKRSYHEKRMEYYEKKIEDVKAERKRIGFKFY